MKAYDIRTGDVLYDPETEGFHRHVGRVETERLGYVRVAYWTNVEDGFAGHTKYKADQDVDIQRSPESKEVNS